MTRPGAGTRAGRRAPVSFVVGALLLASACGGGNGRKPVAQSSSASASAPAGGGTPSSPSSEPGAAPTSAATPRPTAAPALAAPGTRRPKTVTFGRITFSVPADWGIDIEGDTAFVGVLAGGTDDVMLRVERNFAGSIDSLKPAGCTREGDPPERALSVDTAESGLRQVGDKKAEYRLWRVTCSGMGTREHRAWLLPTSRIVIYEQVHEGHPENVDVVTTAVVR